MKETKLTEKDLKILEVIKNRVGAIGPTEIGIKLGQCYTQASSYCNSSLKKLLAAGLIVKITTDRVKYKLKQIQK
jgi:hypothetical protein